MAFDIKRLDIYRKVPKDLTQPTYTGAIISVCCCLFMTLLFLSEFMRLVSPEIVSELYVDNPGHNSNDERIPVELNITLPKMSCDVIGLDIQDDLGRHEVGFVENVIKTPLMDGRGCNFKGKFFINKVPGNFHVSTHSAGNQPNDMDFAHEIEELILGQKIDNPRVPGSFNPLHNRKKLDGKAVESHEYVMKVVPTIYEDIWGDTKVSYQYTYAYRSYLSFSHNAKIIPAIWFRYDLTPITVKYHEKRQPFYSFLTTVCAIIGGTFTVAGIIDSCIFSASELFKKFEIGKLS